MTTELKFKLKSPPFSINSAYYKRSKTRTAKCRAWGSEIHRQISQPDLKQKFVDFRTNLKNNSHISVQLDFLYPHTFLYTQSGDISRRSMDLSNIEKMLIDLIFDSRFEGRHTDCGLEITTLCQDDKTITELISRKLKSPDNDHHIEITIKIQQK